MDGRAGCLRAELRPLRWDVPRQVVHVAQERADALVLRVLDWERPHPLELARDLGPGVGWPGQRLELLVAVFLVWLRWF